VSKGLRPRRARLSLGVFACVAALGCAAIATTQVAAGSSDATATTAKKHKRHKRAGRCSARTLRHLHGKKRKTRRRDCKDKVLGKAENPRRQPYDGKRIPTPNSSRCDLFDSTQCLQPWPNDYFTVADGSTSTGRRLNINRLSMPANKDGVHIDPTDWNRSDGFSTGQTIVLKIPGLDTQAAFNKTGLVPNTDLAKYGAPAQPVVVINTATNQRQMIWAELDSQPTNPQKVNLLIHPGKDFAEGGHYVVALRNLKRANGKTIAPPKTFRVYRDRLITKQKPIESRRKHMESLFKELKQDGIQRHNLYVAWDFTVESQNDITSRVLAMRNDALGGSTGNRLDDPNIGNGDVTDGNAPTFTVDSIVDNPNSNILRQIRGTLTNVPCYLNTNGCPPGSTFAYSSASDRTPNFNPSYTMDVPFECDIPNSVVQAGPTLDPARPMEFGHGLLDDYQAVGHDGERVNDLANEHNLMGCAVSWAGFSDEDKDTIIGPTGNAKAGILYDLSKFPKLADRIQQGYINFMYLGRAMMHPGGFSSDAAFQVDPNNPTSHAGGFGSAIDTSSDLYFEGISQGAVEGGALTALSPDISRSVLNVGGMNYSVLLNRSSDWPLYEFYLQNGYPDPSVEPLLLSMIQVLWDRAETNGFSQHTISNPYADTPAKQVLLQADYGDFQVANIQAEVEARTMGLKVYDGTSPFGMELYPGRHWSSSPLFGLTRIPSFPYTGSALVYWDGGPLGFVGTDGDGTGVPPNGNEPPTAGADPHSYSRKDVQARTQVSDFFSGGFGACTSGGPCYDNGFTGP
jgi:hypothetical protein